MMAVIAVSVSPRLKPAAMALAQLWRISMRTLRAFVRSSILSSAMVSPLAFQLTSNSRVCRSCVAWSGAVEVLKAVTAFRAIGFGIIFRHEGAESLHARIAVPLRIGDVHLVAGAQYSLGIVEAGGALLPVSQWSDATL